MIKKKLKGVFTSYKKNDVQAIAIPYIIGLALQIEDESSSSNWRLDVN